MGTTALWVIIAMAQTTGLSVAGVPVPWSVLVTILGGAMAWATLRADVRAIKKMAGDAHTLALSADRGVSDLKIHVNYIRRELNLMNGKPEDSE